MSLLLKLESASFVYLKKELHATQGNLSVQLDKLHQKGYVKIKKGYAGKYPQTLCSITPFGVIAFKDHVQNLKNYLHL
jgi:DNA-binding MarR family transcriptional regulator